MNFLDPILDIPTDKPYSNPVYSGRLHFPEDIRRRGVVSDVFSEIEKTVLQKNYPCVAAIKSVRDKEYMVGVYQDFGSGNSWIDIRQDLQYFLKKQKETDSTYLTFWAVFAGQNQFSEDEFEKHLWEELSYLTSIEDKEKDWGQNISDPQDPKFCLSIDGTAFFVVGMHSKSSRWARRFSYPTLIFNAMGQFENLARLNQYEAMKKANRKRDMEMQNSVNPMVEKYGDDWESIQFSGKENPETWGCPFRFLFRKEKNDHVAKNY